MHTANTHVIYWDPNEEFTGTTKGIVGSFFTDVAHDSGLATNAFGIAGQYTDKTGNAAYTSTFGGALPDTQAYPTTGNCTVPNEQDKGPYATCLFDSQLQTELSRFINEQSLPKGPAQLYFLVLPHSVATCLPDEVVEVEPGVFETVHPCSNNFFCAYHSYIGPGTANEIIYANIPFSLLDTGFAKGCQDDGHPSNIQQPNPDNAGGKNSETRFADVALKYISHEYIEATTDPLVGGFVGGKETTAWVDEFGLEIGDKCNGVHGDGSGIGYDAHAFTPTLGGSAITNNLFNQSINEGHFYLQSEWDNAGAACLMEPLELTSGNFTATPSSQLVGNSVAFNGTVVDPYGEPGFSWSFGDGSTGTGPSASHAYAAPGVYTVTLTAKDALTGSTAAPSEHTVVISGPPTATAPVPTPPPVPAAAVATVVLPNSAFSPLHATYNPKTGVITLTGVVGDPGTFSWLLTFQNGKFGVFAASTAKCKKSFVRLKGKCRPASIVYGRGSKLVPGAGTVSFTVKPSASALKALRNALKKKKGLPVSVKLTFQSSRGGSPVTHTQAVTVKLKK